MGLSLHLFFIYFGAMQKANVLQLIDEKLKQLEEAEKASLWKSKLSFGVHLNVYKDSPYMPAFLKKRKGLNRRLLIGALVIPVIVLLFSMSYGSWPEESLLKTVVKLVLNALFTGGILIYGMLHSIVQGANDAQQDVKKMMLRDLRQKVEALEEVSGQEAPKNAVGSF